MKKRVSVWVLGFVLCQALLAFKTCADGVRMEVLDLGEVATGRRIKVNIWFPQGNCANLAAKLLCLADTAITDKVAVFSHGAMGSSAEYGWLGQGLANAGYVVVGINHFGESWVYGKETVDPRITHLIWQRAQDISALLDRFTKEPIFQKKINWSNAIAIGHSSGGQTAAMLGGARFDLTQLIDFCSSEQSKSANP